MSRFETNFVAKCLAGDALAEDVDDYVHLWHSGAGDPDASLADFLGFTAMEYRLWAEKPHLLPLILSGRRSRVPLESGRDDDETYRLAARELSAEDAEELIHWLKATRAVPSGS